LRFFSSEKIKSAKVAETSMFHAASNQECPFLGNHSYFSQKKPRPKPGLFVWTVSYDYWLLTFNSTRLILSLFCLAFTAI
jgi:hypothetical protein